MRNDYLVAAAVVAPPSEDHHAVARGNDWAAVGVGDIHAEVGACETTHIPTTWNRVTEFHAAVHRRNRSRVADESVAAGECW